jgi:hypothetical protein
LRQRSHINAAVLADIPAAALCEQGTLINLLETCGKGLKITI